MNKKKEKTDLGFSKTWILLCGILLISQLLGWGIMTRVVFGEIYKQNMQVNRNAIKVLTQMVDDQTELQNKIISTVATDSLVVSRMTAGYANNGYRAMQNMKIKNMLATHMNQSSYIEDIYLYIGNTDDIISANTTAEESLFYEMYGQEVVADRGEWEQLLAGKYNQHYKVVTGKNDKQRLIWLWTLASHEDEQGQRRNCTVVIVLNIQEYLAPIIDYQAATGNPVTVRSADGTVIFEAGNESEDRGEVLRVVSETNGWEYMIYLDGEDFVSSYIGLFALLTTILVLVLTIIFCVVAYVVRFHFNPLKELVGYIRENYGQDPLDETSSYTYLKGAFSTLLEKQRLERLEFKKQMEKVRGAYVLELLLGSTELAEIGVERLREMGLEYLLKQVAVLIIRKKTGWSSEERLNPLMVAKFFGLGVERDYSRLGYSIFLKGDLVTVVEAGEGDIKKIIQEMQDVFSRMESKEFYAALSAVKTVGNLDEAYNEALFTMSSMKSGDESSSILCYDDVVNLDTLFFITAEMENRLTDAAVRLDRDLLLKEMGDGWEELNNSQKNDLNSAQYLAFRQMDVILRAVRSLGFKEVCSEMANSMGLIYRAQNKEAVIKLSMDMVGKLFEQLGTDEDTFSQTVKIKNMVNIFIEENFMDSGLTVDKVAEALGKSTSGISKLYKEATGDTILYYINYCRIQEAKKLIVQKGSKCNISQLHEIVGFTNTNTLIRVFKKYEGVTPGKYKEIVMATKNG